jgi:CubicO group peptidase (beta-lactamase class C family)
MTTTDAVAAGIDEVKLNALLDRARKEVDEGILPSAQVAVAKDGRLVAFETFGDATNDTRYIIFSATKPFVASSVWQLLEAGELSTDNKIADIIPTFGSNGKDVITLEQVMLHTSGFPTSIIRGASEWEDKERRAQAFASWTLDYEPGTKYWYHPTAAHWVLAEVIERVTGEDFRSFVRSRVVEPLGLPKFQLGVPEDQQGDIADLELRGEPMSPDELEAAIGIRELPQTEASDENLTFMNRPEMRAVGVPGGGGIGTAADLAIFYQKLMRNEEGLWGEAFLHDVTQRVWQNLPDLMFGTPANRGLGVVIAGDDGKAAMRGFGHTNSPRAFGHNGAAGQIAWGDPHTGLSFGYCTNGIDRHMIRQARRSVGLSSRAAALTDR